MSQYATTEQAKLFGHETDSLDDDSWNLLLVSASRTFDNLTEVIDGFYDAATGTNSSKVFTGDGTAYLKLPPYIAIATVTPIVIVDDNDNALTIPTYREQEGVLVIRGQGVRRNSPLYYFTGWPLNTKITVSANWGFAIIPADVTTATIQIALHLFRTVDPASAQLSDTTAALQLAIPVTAQKTIDKYRSRYSNRAIFA